MLFGGDPLPTIDSPQQIWTTLEGGDVGRNRQPGAVVQVSIQPHTRSQM